jgi:hypothetical protein
MNERGLSLLEVCVIVIVISILAALLVPGLHEPGIGHPRRVACANNLMQLYKLGTVYSSTHKGQWPDLSGDELWLSFTKTTPPLIPPEYAEILACPWREEDCAPGQTDFFGPRVPWKKLGPGDPLGGDKPGNHGEQEGGFVLFKDGRVEEVDAKSLRR